VPNCPRPDTYLFTYEIFMQLPEDYIPTEERPSLKHRIFFFLCIFSVSSPISVYQPRLLKSILRGLSLLTLVHHPANLHPPFFSSNIMWERERERRDCIPCVPSYKGCDKLFMGAARLQSRFTGKKQWVTKTHFFPLSPYRSTLSFCNGTHLLTVWTL